MANVFMIQLIAHKTGKRSDPFGADMEQLKEILRHTEDENDDDYVLMVGVKPDDGDFQVTNTPLITIKQLKASLVEESING